MKLSDDVSRSVADFVILEEFELRIAFAMRNLPYDAYGGLKDATFWVASWKKATEGLEDRVLEVHPFLEE
ncbi:hypothetical protein AKJ57_02290 [candidate division MSBL1 archaeon SCGC-AAA259A05]|uniref:Uncharacterized protein n=1 Tax=candidate division MSBL1 archaeon SCGC-AAA259A05 TaxID=1698259 RepID=A0A133UAB0_9EURY|nr:hypothetical protein AKJ57_02290 [candidate division MSBL1 archaeon SCGC-AAA259A05]